MVNVVIYNLISMISITAIFIMSKIYVEEYLKYYLQKVSSQLPSDWAID